MNTGDKHVSIFWMGASTKVWAEPTWEGEGVTQIVYSLSHTKEPSIESSIDQSLDSFYLDPIRLGEPSKNRMLFQLSDRSCQTVSLRR